MEKKVFIEDSFVETQTRFFENGKVVTDLCGWEVDKIIVANGRTEVRQRGIMTTTDGVGTTFIPYNTGGKPMYIKAFDTQHGVIKHSTNNIVVHFKLPKDMGKQKMLTVLYKEMMEIRQFIKNQEEAV